LVKLKSASVLEATAIVLVAELFALFVSPVLLFTVTVSVMIVPALVPAATW
jgi:hypothetical protein